MTHGKCYNAVMGKHRGIPANGTVALKTMYGAFVSWKERGKGDMPRGTNQKLKLYYLAKIMQEKTDLDHYLTMPEIMEELARYGVTAGRKSLYQDLKDLEILGIEVEGEAVGGSYHYHVIHRKFELAELKLLVDSIQSAKFITARKSDALIRKLEDFASEYEAKELQRQVYLSDRVKSVNETIYYSVDVIHDAINNNRKITFQYFNWNVRKEMELRHDGAYYIISPWGLLWDNENYYLIGYDAVAGKLKHYRVDKMLHLAAVDEPREGGDSVKDINIAEYARKSFHMFRGEEETVKLRMKNSFAGVIIDRFGKDVWMLQESPEYFTATVKVQLSMQFIHWVFSLGDGAEIVGPKEVLVQVREEIQRLQRSYREGD